MQMRGVVDMLKSDSDRNHEALLLIVESGGIDGVRTSYVVAVVCDDQLCSHLLHQLYQWALALPDCCPGEEISLDV